MPSSLDREVEQLSVFYASVTPSQGEYLYKVVRSLGATRIVEYGTSVGISAIYLGAAVRDNGGGVVIGSELHPAKHAAALRNVAAAGLSEIVEVRLGNAVETLKDPGGTVDMMFLDGYPPLYLAILQAAMPFLRKGSVVIADNIYTHARILRPYRQFVRDAGNGFTSRTLRMKFGVEYSTRV